MHRALLLNEIIVHILGFTDRQTQSRCARVCKGWEDVGLDFLWSSIEDPSVLLPSLGINRWVDLPEKVQSAGDDLTRFRRTTSRVRKIREDYYGYSFVRHIIAANLAPPLFPNLTSLELTRAFSVEIEIALPMFLTPNLRHLILSDELYLDEHTSPVITALSPNLRVLSISRLPSLVDWKTLIQSLPGLKGVQFLFRMLPFSSNGIEPLMDPGHIRCINHVTSLQVSTRSIPKNCINLGRFPCLQMLNLACDSLDEFEHFWPADHALHLRSLELTIMIPAGTLAAGPFNRIVVTSPHLTRLEYTAHTDDQQCGSHCTVLDLLALAKLSHLAHLHIRTPVPLLATTEEVKWLFASLPRLRECALSPSHVADPGPQPSLAVLPFIAQHCLLLEKLSLSVGGSWEFALSYRFRALRELRLCFSTEIKEVSRSAKLLQAILPSTCSEATFISYAIVPNDNPNGGHAALWGARRSVESLQRLMTCMLGVKMRYQETSYGQCSKCSWNYRGRRWIEI